MAYNTDYILKHTHARLLSTELIIDTIEHFVFDTRKLYFVDKTLFVAFNGASTDGHTFILDAYAKGVRNFLVSQDIDVTVFKCANFFKVNNTVSALQRLAKVHRQTIDIPVIGVTGSTGKTSIKEWLYQLMTPELKVVKNPRSYNSSIGVPLSLLAMKDWHDIGIFEAGPAAGGDMDALVDMILPTIGVFSNIGDAHSANYNGITEKITEKLKLFKQVDVLIFCADHKKILNEVKINHIPFFSWSEDSSAQVVLSRKNIKDEGIILSIKYENKSFDVYLPYRDGASVENAMHCITCLLYLQFEIETIQTNISKLSRLNMRMEMKRGVRDCTILDDSYSADLDSFIIAMDFLERQSTKAKKTLVISDFVQSENGDGRLYHRISDYINGSSVQKVIAIGSGISKIETLLNDSIKFKHFKNIDYLLNDLWRETSFNNEIILVKGARKFNLERLTIRLYERTHNTVLEVNMYGLAKNLKVYSELLKPTTKLMVMIKASAYGAGSTEVAKMLEYNNIDYLAVAYADEGIHLRKQGITTPIMVLNPEIPQFEQYIEYHLEPEIYSLKMLKKLAFFLKLNDFKLKIHIKIESGMNRLGFVEEEHKELIDILKSTPQIIIESIFSHLSSSGEDDKDEYTHKQVERYIASYDLLSKALGVHPLRHIVNSAGIIRFKDYHFDMVRLGAGLYGIDSYLPFREKITTVLSFKSRISQIKSIKKGDSVGYSRGFIAPKDMKIAIVSAGYADGIPRSVSFGKYQLLVQGKKAPILGPVAMDMCMIDVTDIPFAQEEDEVVVFGNNYPVSGLAKAANTISYEIFTSISERVKRIYFY
ncbi:MAG: bifunctional UDP-N-acetylmuramoyl-tripeptide:D-alanyl-D-alanine ligase/alanine racemase [Saprospiraceae bacterium]